MSQPAAPSAPDRIRTQAQAGQWRRAIHRSDLTARTILLGLRIAEYINPQHDWLAWPAQATLAEETGTTVRRVRDRINGPDGLVRNGWLIIVTPPTPHSSARYALSADRLQSGRSTGSNGASPTGSNGASPTGSNGASSTGSNGASEGSKNVPKTCLRDRVLPEAADPAEADASPVAAPISRFLTDPLEVIQG